MIKVLFFVDTLIGGGASKVLRDLVNAMDKSEFAVTVQTLYPEENAKELAEGIRYRYCYGAKNRLNKARMRIEAALGLTYSLHIKDDYDIEAAYLECGSTKIMAGSTNKKALKLAWVHCDIEKMAQGMPDYAKKTLRWYNKFDKVICVSGTVKQAFDRMYDHKVKTEVLYNTVNDESMCRKAAEPLPDSAKRGAKTLVSVGTLYAPKNQLRLLRAVKRLVEEGMDVALWILGDGPDREMLESYIDDNGLKQNVMMFGFCDNPYPYISNADLAVCSSNYEGFSTFVTEALILGTPTVTTDVSGMRELLGDSEYGLITENDDEALYQGIKRMLTEEGLLEHYAERARQRGGEFKQSVLAKRTEETLKRLLNEKRHSI